MLPIRTGANYNEGIMELKGKKVAMLVDNVYQEMEVWYPLYRFQEAGAEVITVGAIAGHTYTSKLGYPVKCDKSYDEVHASDFDGVIIPVATLRITSAGTRKRLSW
jgi:Putative intracellular protease/amidase